MNKNLSFKRIFHSGVSSSNPSYLNQKIILTNDISLLLAGLSLPFLVFTAIYFPPLLIYPIVFLLFGISVVILNYFGHHLLARFIVCAVYITIYTIYHAYLLPANHHFVGALYAIQIVFWMPPWLVFDLQEKKWLITYVAYYTLLTFSLPYLNNFFELSLDNFALVKDGILATIILSIAFVAISGSVFILIYINQKTESKNEVLFNQIRIKNIELEKTNEEVKKQQEDIHLFNSRLKANEAILRKSYEKLKQSEKELSAKAKLLEEQQSEIIAQNEELQQQQEEMRTVNESLAIASNKLKSNELILKKAYEKLKESEKELKEKTEILESQQAEIITQNEELQQQQEEILSVNETLEYTLKQFKITTERLNKSITYANNIQKTILPEPEKLDAFFDTHFSLYLPKDVVSGDFY
nr:hypothetical protein [Thermoflexibacter sp.]